MESRERAHEAPAAEDEEEVAGDAEDDDDDEEEEEAMDDDSVNREEQAAERAEGTGLVVEAACLRTRVRMMRRHTSRTYTPAFLHRQKARKIQSCQHASDVLCQTAFVPDERDADDRQTGGKTVSPTHMSALRGNLLEARESDLNIACNPI